jgi:hypothetical protein
LTLGPVHSFIPGPVFFKVIQSFWPIFLVFPTVIRQLSYHVEYRTEYKLTSLWSHRLLYEVMSRRNQRPVCRLLTLTLLISARKQYPKTTRIFVFASPLVLLDRRASPICSSADISSPRFPQRSNPCLIEIYICIFLAAGA